MAKEKKARPAIPPQFSEDAIALEFVRRMEGKVRFFRNSWYLLEDDTVIANEVAVRREVRLLCREIAAQVTNAGGSVALARKIASEATYRHVLELAADDPQMEVSDTEYRQVAKASGLYFHDDSNEEPLN